MNLRFAQKSNAIVRTWISTKNPSTLIDGRILNNITFALRLHNFLSSLECEDHTELDKCVSFAKELLDYQIATCTDEKEKAYFKNNNIIV